MIEYDIKSSNVALKFLDKAQARLGDTNTPLIKAGMIMLRSIDKNFRAEGRPTKWKGLSAMTKAFRRKGKAKKGGERVFKILQDTGRLKGSISARTTKGQVEIGTNLSYAKLMDRGGMSEAKTFKIKEHKRKITQTFGRPIGWEAYQTVKAHDIKIGPKRVPARPFILFQTSDVAAIEKLGLRHLEDATK